jgi:hypothetical protein
MKSRVVILFFAFVSVFIMFNREAYKHNLYRWDPSGYYVYLPAAFIYHDIGGLGFYADLNRKYGMCDTDKMYGIFAEPGGKRNNKYAPGTALFEMPFFLVAHAYCLVTGGYLADGYSTPYQLAGLLSTIFWVCMGLLFIRAFLRRYFDDNITAFTLLCVAFGTNIYCYTVFAPVMSHPYSFFLFAGILYCTDALYKTQQQRYFYWLGLLMGLVFITRPVNIVVGLMPLFWEVDSAQSFRERFLFFRKYIKEVSLGVFILFVVSLIQIGYWKYTPGHWLHYSYVGEGFNFLKPHIIDGLLSYQKGWFLYTPIALVSMLGFYTMRKVNKAAIPGLVLFFLLMVYMVFSWREWAYGGSFSARALVETLPVAAFPLACLLQDVYRSGRALFLKIAFSVAMTFLIVLNLFQSYQFNGNVIHYCLMTRAYYWRVFGKVTASPEDTQYLMTWDEYFKDNPGVKEQEEERNKVDRR